jgi:hypothetical protein
MMLLNEASQASKPAQTRSPGTGRPKAGWPGCTWGAFLTALRRALAVWTT